MGSCNCNSARHSHTVSRKLGRFFRTSHRHKYPQIQANKKMKAGSAFVGYYILALLLLNLVNVSKCSDESNEENAEDEDVTHEEESEEDEVIDDEEEDETDLKSVKSTDLEEYESMISSRDFRSIIIGVVGFWGGVFLMGSVYLLMVLAKRVFKPEEADKSPA